MRYVRVDSSQVEKLTSEQSSSKLEQIHLQKSIQELGVCDNNMSFKEMVEELMEKYKDLKETYEQTCQQLQAFLSPLETTASSTSSTSISSSIQGLLDEAMKW